MERDRGGGRDEQDRAGIVGGRSPILTPTARDDGVAGDAQPFGRVVEIGGKDDDERRRHDASPHCRRASRTGASRASNRAVSRLFTPPSRTLVSTANHRSEEHTSALQSPMRHSSAVFFLKKKKQTITKQ